MVCCQRDELVAPPIEERVRGDDERTGLLSSHGSKRCFDLVFAAGPKDRHFLPERTGSRLCGSHLGVAVQIGRIHEISMAAACGTSSCSSCSRLVTVNCRLAG